MVTKLRILTTALMIMVLSGAPLISQIRIEVPDTTFPRGAADRIKLEIIGTIGVSPIQNLTLVLAYNAKVLDITAARGGTNFAFRQDTLQLTKDFTSLDNALVTITGNNVQQVTNGAICIIELEGLASSDSLSFVKPEKIIINGTTRNDLEIRAGTIKVTGTPVFPTIYEGIGDNYPNPFDAQTKIDFSLKSKSKAKFMIYSSSGEAIGNSWSNDESIGFDFFTKDGLKLQVNSDFMFDRGEYYLIITPVIWKFSSGAYFIAMETDKGVYFKSLMYVK